MKVCKVKPSIGTCMACMDIEIEYGQFNDCHKCSCNTNEYELLSTGVSFFGSPYAIVQRKGTAEKVALSRVHSIREV